ncbi:MAG TPA: DMT family transporter [Anaerolineae bacterium]|nr:DMT family transporter [Anaerolineae bacterium]HQI86819.1 DMT family transporter [Anaerolineae bacterium]
MQRWKADMALVLVTAIWGSTFVVVKNALDTVGPLVFVATRFWVAGSALVGLLFVQRKVTSRPIAIRPRALRDGALTGVFLTIGYVMQTIGLQTTEAAKAAFITGLSVVLVPVFAATLLRKPPTRAATIGVVMATLGLGALTLDLKQHIGFAPGDLWVLVCAVGFAAHIISTARFAPHHDVLPFTATQLLTTAFLATAAALFFERHALLPPASTLPAIIYMGLIASAFVFGVQTWGQRHTTPTHTALIFALEPVFAAWFAVVFAGEVLEAREWIGGALILVGMIVAEVGNSTTIKRRKTTAI